MKRLSMVIKLELGRGTFQHSPSSKSELSVLGLSCLPINHQHRLQAPSRGQLVPLPSSVSKISKISSRKLLSGQVLEPEGWAGWG